MLGDLAVQLKLNPLYLMLPATVTCCYAFMLPVSCPPNAIVYKASGDQFLPPLHPHTSTPDAPAAPQA